MDIFTYFQYQTSDAYYCNWDVRITEAVTGVQKNNKFNKNFPELYFCTLYDNQRRIHTSYSIIIINQTMFYCSKSRSGHYLG